MLLYCAFIQTKTDNLTSINNHTKFLCLFLGFFQFLYVSLQVYVYIFCIMVYQKHKNRSIRTIFVNEISDLCGI